MSEEWSMYLSVEQLWLNGTFIKKNEKSQSMNK